MGVYGMTYNEFWYGDPWLAASYRKAYVERRKAENTRDWLQGAYFYNAITAAMANAFHKKGAQPVNYLEEPFQIFPLTAEEKAEKQAKEEKILMDAMLRQAAQFRATKAAQEQDNGSQVRDIRTGDSPEHKVIAEQST